MKTYEVKTQWIGFSLIKVKALSADHACEMVESGDYIPIKETYTGNGLSQGFDCEEVLDIREYFDDETVLGVKEIL